MEQFAAAEDVRTSKNPLGYHDRLIPLLVGFKDVGLSKTSGYRELADPNSRLPKPVSRGRYRYFLSSELNEYVQELAKQRVVS